MGDIERLKKQISELESQKKKLQFDSERLKQTLNEITLKQVRLGWLFFFQRLSAHALFLLSLLDVHRTEHGP